MKREHAAIVGAGRMGTAMARALKLAGWTVQLWSPSQRGRRVEGIPVREGALPLSFAPAKLLLLTVPDARVAEVAKRIADETETTPGQIAAHCSGSLGLDVLQPLADQGLEVGSLHPLVAAAPGEVRLSGRWGAVDGSPDAIVFLEAVAKAVGLWTFEIPASERPRYHAAASLAANGLVSLTDLSLELLQRCGVVREQALPALLCLLESAIEGMWRTGLPEALTGPVARGDAAVVEGHLRVLDVPGTRDAYIALAKHALQMARSMDHADPEGLERIATLLDEV